MTKPRVRARCRWCGRPIPARENPTGRPREFCRRSCRQRDYESRCRARAHGLDEHEIIMARNALAALDDRIYVLACALEDVEGDLQESAEPGEVREALDALLDAARPVVSARRDGT